METDAHSTASTALLDTPGTQRAFDTVKNGITVYGALSAAALLAVIAVAATGHTVNTFMWVRAALLPVVAVLMHRVAGTASRGSRRAFDRVSALAVVVPIAIIGVDLIPGVCPLWYAVMQAVCVLPVVRVAVVTRGSVLRAAFPKGR